VTTYRKRRIFSEEEYSKSLQELDLCTNCIVEVTVGPVPELDSQGKPVDDAYNDPNYVGPIANRADLAANGVRVCGDTCAVM